MQAVIPDWTLERMYWQQGYDYVAGVDEAGRGAWAGPVTVAAVILPKIPDLPFRDSKQLSPHERERLACHIRHIAIAWAVEHSWPEEIDALNILGATYAAAHRALARLQPAPQALITDYLKLKTALALSAPPRADSRSLTVAAASILAKTERDQVMIQLDAQYPGYGLAAHKGYGVPKHHTALKHLGVSSVHRCKFAPIARLLDEQSEANTAKRPISDMPNPATLRR